MVDDASGPQYQSLYRRYRPQRFSEVKGQDHVVMALRNAVRDDRVVHAYLFSGPRGTGKTSTARVLAKALNCLDLEPDGEPCGRCSSCLDIARGASLDVHELDAASNNGVDAMRDLVSRAVLATPGKWKVYIVDEVHMLSTAASNALLKTLEEPPGHVVFVLATTDPQKVLPTIRSRTQHYEFHLFEPDVLKELLDGIVADAHLEIPDGGVDAAIRRGHGSARDAVSALDQVAAAGVLDDDHQYVREVIEAIVERDASAALRGVAGAVAAGFDAGRFSEELVDELRTIFLGAVAPGLLRHNGSDAAGEAPPALSPARCVRAMELLGTALVDMREALDPRITLEVALVRLSDPEVDESPAALLDRIDRLERRVSELASLLSEPAGHAAPPPAPPQQSGPASSGGGPAAPPSVPPAASGGGGPSASAATSSRPALGAFRTTPPGAGPTPSGVSSSEGPGVVALATREEEPPAPAQDERPLPTRGDIVTAWGDRLLTSLRPRVKAVYAVGRWLSMEDGTAVFALPNAAHVAHAEPSRGDVAAVLSQHFGCRIEVRLATDLEPVSDTPSDAPADEAPAPEEAPARSGPRPSERLAAAAAEVKAAPAPDDAMELEELEPSSDAGHHDSLRWAESRLLDAFPGAEEVTG